jgi:uncharacterized protein YdcH (DUF465 family)
MEKTMPYRERIKHLEELHRFVDKQILDMEGQTHYIPEQVTNLKKRKLQLKDEIARLSKLQFEATSGRETDTWDDR